MAGSAAIKEVLNLTKNVTPAISTVMEKTQELINHISVEYEMISPEVIATIESSVMEFIGNIGRSIINWASGLLKYLLSIPNIIINVVITVLALVFFTKDRIYMIDLLEHHLPKTWIKNISTVTSEFFGTLLGYIKVYLKIITITFVELYLAFNIYNALGFKIEYPFLLAVIVAIVDILPVLGVGTVLIPWSIWLFITSNYGFAIAVFITYITIFVIRQLLEPKLVSKQFGIHPIVTLFAMYAGFRASGVIGLILGPIALMILRCIFATQLERGLFKDLFDEN